MAIVRVTSKGQATLPKELREKFGIKAPGEVEVREQDGRIVIEPVRTLAQARAYWVAQFASPAGATWDEIRKENERAERRGEQRLERMMQKRRRRRSP
ncbi:MAG: AbrB/MazE/SpoVT family DNA-binding domain-containing protein [Halobacteriales archaeon]|nr:AbrB/MazE/SpoVT family DNA-binding domain-containing protein [Halobacteriales archaeon]